MTSKIRKARQTFTQTQKLEYAKFMVDENYTNQLNRHSNPGRVNTHWVGDITYIRHHVGWSYLATVLGLGSREVVGYALSQTPDVQLSRPN